MNRMLAIVQDEQKLHAFQQMVQMPIFQEVIKGIREALPCSIPPPDKCSEGYLGAITGKQTTRDLILDVMVDPDHWIRLSQFLSKATAEEYAETIQHLEEDSVFWKDRKLTSNDVREELKNQ